MSIHQLKLTDFRNLVNTTLDFHPSLNVIYGDNGSGKTSLLEAIYALCQANSFRQHYFKKCIQHGKDQFLLFGHFTEYKVGLAKSDDKLEIRVNGQSIKRRSQLVSKTPINIINSDSISLITGSPEKRRQYVDWCLFHLEQTYIENWVCFRHALRQRNKLLKISQNHHLLDYWDDYIIKPSLVLQKMRSACCQEISHVLNSELFDLITNIKITLQYQQGWQLSSSLLECLKKNRERDIHSGFTRSGIHRDDLLIFSDGLPATDVLSRGELKGVSLALLVATLKIVSRCYRRPIILLLDDLQAEVDELTQDKIYKAVFDMDVQLFITSLDSKITKGLQGKDFKMFHVERGMIKPVKFV